MIKTVYLASRHKNFNEQFAGISVAYNSTTCASRRFPRRLYRSTSFLGNHSRVSVQHDLPETPTLQASAAAQDSWIQLTGQAIPHPSIRVRAQRAAVSGPSTPCSLFQQRGGSSLPVSCQHTRHRVPPVFRTVLSQYNYQTIIHTCN